MKNKSTYNTHPPNYYYNKICMITGASGGIGSQILIELLSSGAKLSIIVRKEIPSTIKNLKIKHKNNLLIVTGDLTKQETCRKFVHQTIQKFQRIDGVLHCAGVSMRCRASQMQLKYLKNIVDVNFTAFLYLYKFTRNELHNNKGFLAVTSSVQGLIALPERSVYAASKHAINSFMKSIRFEEIDIQCTTINFGYVSTDFSKNALTEDGKKYNTMDRNQQKGINPTTATRKLLKAIYQEKDEIFIVGLKERLALLMLRFTPSLLEKWLDRNYRAIYRRNHDNQ